MTMTNRAVTLHPEEGKRRESHAKERAVDNNDISV